MALTDALNNYAAAKSQEYSDDIQPFLNKMPVSGYVGSNRFESQLTVGYRFNNPYLDNVRLQDYVANQDLVRDPVTATNEYLEIDQSKATIVTIDPTVETQIKARHEAQLKFQMGYEMSNAVDQVLIGEAINVAKSSVSGGTLTTANIFAKMTELGSAIKRKRGFGGEMCFITDPERVALLQQYMASTGNDVADAMLTNGVVGRVNGFTIIESNNLPSSAPLTIAANPTAGDTMTVAGNVYTFVAAGTAAVAGDISLGASAAATQANVVLALTRTGTAGASTYIDLATEQSREMDNIRLSITAFSSNVATITANDRLGVSETFASGSNLFGTETTQSLLMQRGAVDVIRMIKPTITPREEQRNLGINYIGNILFGVKGYYRQSHKIGVLTHNA